MAYAWANQELFVDFSQFFLNTMLADVFLEIGFESIPLHRSIVGAQSKQLYDWISNDGSALSIRFPASIGQVGQTSATQFFKFLYTHRIELDDLDAKSISELSHIAREFQLNSLLYIMSKKFGLAGRRASIDANDSKESLFLDGDDSVSPSSDVSSASSPASSIDEIDEIQFAAKWWYHPGAALNVKLLQRLGTVQLRVSNFQFSVCPPILAARSSYFSSLFSGNWADSGSNRFDLNQIDPSTFEQVLQVIYTGQLPPTNSFALFAQPISNFEEPMYNAAVCDESGRSLHFKSQINRSLAEATGNLPDFSSTSTLSSNLVIHRCSFDDCIKLLRASQFFSIPVLDEAIGLEICRRYLKPETACSIWHDTSEFELEDLHAACCQLIQKNFVPLARQPETRDSFMLLTLSQLKDVLSPGKIEQDHDQCIEVIRDWCVRQSNGDLHEAKKLYHQLTPPQSFVTRLCKENVLEIPFMV